MTPLELPHMGEVGIWRRVPKRSAVARALADRHYSRQTIGADDFIPPGRCLVLVTPCGRATWAVVENRDPVGALRWRCTIFRNEGAGLSSDLVRAATSATFDYWRRHYHGLPVAPLRTEVDPAATRRKRDPGRCFIRAGWRVVAVTPASHGRPSLVVLEAPTP